MKKLILLTSSIFLILFFSASAFGQIETSDQETYNRWSASLYAGYILPENDRGNQIFASRFNVPSDPSWGLGASVNFALNPFWSLEGGYRYSDLEGDGFETTVNSASLKSIFNLNRLFRRSTLSEVLNPYIILGLEQDFFTAESPTEEFSRSEAALVGGLGVAYRVTERVEIFSQYEVKLTSNRLDLIDRGLPYDEIGMLSGGVKVHFGSSDKKPLNLKPAMRELTNSEYDDLFAKIEKVDDLEERLNSLENHVDEQDSENNDNFEELYRRVAALQERVDSLESKTDSLSMNCCTGQTPEEDDRELAETVAAGHYVQVFASLDYDIALQVKEDFIELFGDQLENPEDEVLIIKRKDFYEVLIGTFEDFSNAQALLPDASDVMPDAFVITFPRPIHLEEQYEGTVIVHNRY